MQYRPIKKISIAFLILGWAAAILSVAQPEEGTDLAAAHSASLPFDNNFFEGNRAYAINNYLEAIPFLKNCLNFRPDEHSVHHILSKIYKELGRAEEAFFHAGEAVRLNPQNYWYYVAQSEIYRKFNYYKQAADALMEASRLVPSGAEGLQLEAADLYIEAMEYKLALKILDQLEKKAGLQDDIIRRKYNILIKSGKTKQAEKLLEKLRNTNNTSDLINGALLNHYKYFRKDAKREKLLKDWLRIAPENGEVMVELANLYLEKNRKDQALHQFKKAMTQSDLNGRRSVEILLFLVQKFSEIPFDETKKLAENVASHHPYSPEAQAMLGDLLAREGNIDQAIEAYKKTLSNGGRKETVYQNLLLLLNDKKRFDEILDLGTEAIANFQDNPLFYVLTAMAAFQIADYQKAVELAKSGLPFSVGNKQVKFQLHYLLAESNHHLSNHHASDDHFEKALNIDPNNISALNNYAYYLAEREQNLDKALVLITRAGSIANDHPSVLDTWAWVLYKRGEYEEALVKIKKAIEIDGGKSAILLEHYGDILFTLGKANEAIVAWHQALAIDKENSKLLSKINNHSLR